MTHDDRFHKMQRQRVVDNFLPEEEFERMQEQICGDQCFPWYLNHAKVMHVARMIDPELQKKEIYNWQMVHKFYEGGRPQSQQWDMILPLINRIQPRALIRIKGNLNHHTDNLIEYDYHTDCGEYSEFGQDNVFEGATTAVFYLNDNDGYTFFNDGTRVSSKANRIVFFPVNTPHAGTSTTDTKFRFVLNLNYF